MKKLVKVVRVLDQENKQTLGQKQLLVRGFVASNGIDEFYVELFDTQVINSKDILDASVGKYVWIDLSFSVRKWEKDGRTFYNQNVYGRNVVAF